MEKDLYYELILDKYLDEENLTDEQTMLLEKAKSYFIEKSKENMGIGMLCSAYIFTNEDQNTWEEYSKIDSFLKSYIMQYSSTKGKKLNDYDLEFINYGRTQLVYVLSDKSTGEKITILTKQPIVPYGEIKLEAKNLTALKKEDSNVVAPMDYYTNGEQELYVTPYLSQSRCIASDRKWGIYIPEPFYRFEEFSEKQEEIVNTCMIAKLVSLYNFNARCGIANCKLGGGDFMLPKAWETQTPTIENTLDSLHLIAARKMINCPFNTYLSIIRDEFSRTTINENQDELLLNVRGRVAMKQEHIENGINLGLELIKNKSYHDEYSQQ